MSGAERIRKYREKRKQNAEYRKKENERIEKLRKARVSKMDEDELKRHSAENNERQRNCREAKRKRKSDAESVVYSPPSTPAQNTTPSILKVAFPFKRPQSYGKALNKAFRTLTTSPNKKRIVVSGLAQKIGLQLTSEVERELSFGASPGNPGLSVEIKEKVEQFFFQPDIVYTMPGMKDEMTVWQDGKKMKLRKYYLTMYMREAYAIFSAAHPELELSFSKFCKLRPRNVLFLKNTPIDQCKCQIHENFRLKLKGLGIEYSNNWWDSCLCGSNDFHGDCWKGICLECPGTDALRDALEEQDLNKEVLLVQVGKR